MKAFAIDSSTSRISLAAYNGSLHASLILQAELRQSEKLLPAIEYILFQAELQPKDLEFTAASSGPGSFTGLRLGISALKAFQLATACPLYAIPTLEAYIKPFSDFSGTLIPVIDAKKDRFYFSVYRNGSKSTDNLDLEPHKILSYLDSEETVLAIGDDAPLFKEKILERRPDQSITVFNSSICTAEQLLIIANDLYQKESAPMADYDGPVYIRKSEAEEKYKK